MSPVTLRLDSQTRRRVARIARHRRVPPTRLMREVIRDWAEREEAQGSFYDAIKDLVGVVRTGDPHLSVKTGRRFTEILRKKRRSGRL